MFLGCLEKEVRPDYLPWRARRSIDTRRLGLGSLRLGGLSIHGGIRAMSPWNGLRVRCFGERGIHDLAEEEPGCQGEIEVQPMTTYVWAIPGGQATILSKMWLVIYPWDAPHC
jgi:hypothetical protein